jgi:hypothetical protein
MFLRFRDSKIFAKKDIWRNIVKPFLVGEEGYQNAVFGCCNEENQACH